MYKLFDWKREINKTELCQVIKALENDNIVIFPTETVYGIGANATSINAINKVYEAKNRPREKAINILVSCKEDIEKYAEITSSIEQKIIENFMPGPITIILKRKNTFEGKGFTLDDNTIGVRIPNNKIIMTILENINFPLIAPSANISGKNSGIRVNDIAKDFENSVDIIIDGGDAKLGVSSTIVKVVDNKIHILREGTITKEEIEAKILC
ncbi:MAG: threonylcarbamoyl-AMP synthase [Clostridia bacterium]|nr:threonylcarbamoyl-AMP synthase [Clostridia bacterium]